MKNLSENISGLTTLLQVYDMSRSLEFYRDLLGFALVSTSDSGKNFDWALIKLGAVQLMLNTAYEQEERPVSPKPERVAAHADTVLFFSCSNVDEVYTHLRTRGWKTQKPFNAKYGMRQVFTADPDGSWYT